MKKEEIKKDLVAKFQKQIGERENRIKIRANQLAVIQKEMKEGDDKDLAEIEVLKIQCDSLQ